MTRSVTVNPQWLAQSRERLTEFHTVLAGDGITRGLIGPREIPRLWPRHLDNCAAVADPSVDLVPQAATVVDIGSGAGLPGVVWAVVRPDLRVTLIEPLSRRTVFLQETVNRLGIADRVTVVRGRGQDVEPRSARIVTSRAVASMSALLEVSQRHLAPGGRVLAIKGGRARAELAECRDTIRDAHGSAEVVTIGPSGEDGHPLATVIKIDYEEIV